MLRPTHDTTEDGQLLFKDIKNNNSPHIEKTTGITTKLFGTVSALSYNWYWCQQAGRKRLWIYFACRQTGSPFHRQRVLSPFLSSWCEREEAGRISHITEVETERVRAERGDSSERCRHEGNASTELQNLDHKTVDRRLLQLYWFVSQTVVWQQSSHGEVDRGLAYIQSSGEAGVHP